MINQPLINNSRIIFSDSKISRNFPILFASNEEEHNILVPDGYKDSSFHENIEAIKNRPDSAIFIGITRENFYKIGEILSYIGQVTHNASLYSAPNFEIRMIQALSAFNARGYFFILINCWIRISPKLDINS